jgi:hypothetical protein
MRKMNRRVIGGESGKGDWYQKWYARYLCREWARTHRGVMPQKVELFKLTYKMPAPETVAKEGWYWPEVLLHDTGKRGARVHREVRDRRAGPAPNFIRERHGIPPIDDKVFKPWIKSKKKTWDRRLEPPPTPTAKTSAKSLRQGRHAGAHQRAASVRRAGQVRDLNAHAARHARQPARSARRRGQVQRPRPQPRRPRPRPHGRVVDAAVLRADRDDLHLPPRDLAPHVPARRGPALDRRVPHRVRAR